MHLHVVTRGGMGQAEEEHLAHGLARLEEELALGATAGDQAGVPGEDAARESHAPRGYKFQAMSWCALRTVSVTVGHAA